MPFMASIAARAGVFVIVMYNFSHLCYLWHLWLPERVFLSFSCTIFHVDAIQSCACLDFHVHMPFMASMAATAGFCHCHVQFFTLMPFWFAHVFIFMFTCHLWHQFKDSGRIWSSVHTRNEQNFIPFPLLLNYKLLKLVLCLDKSTYCGHAFYKHYK